MPAYPALPRSANPAHGAAAVAGATSTTLVAAPAAGKWRSYLLIQNVGTESAWIRVDGAAATAASPCILLAAGASFGGTAHVVQGEIRCIRDGAATGDVALSVVVEELDR